MEDGALLESLRALEARHRETMASIIEHLVELERRWLYRKLGYPSLYEYCTRALGLSEDEAYRRIAVARMAAREPAILEGLADGSFHLSGLVALAPHFRRAGAETSVEEAAEAAAELLDLARHQSRREIERRLAHRFPQADAPEIIRGQRGQIDPLSPGRYRLQLTVSQATRDKLERALELMSHQNPEHALGPVLDRALDTLLEKLERAQRAKLAEKSLAPAPAEHSTKASKGRIRSVKPSKQGADVVMPADHRQLDLWEFAATRAATSGPTPARNAIAAESPAPGRVNMKAQQRRRAPHEPPTRHIPRPLRRATFVAASNDGVASTGGEGCCFISEDGRRCGSRHFLEIDHRTPWSLNPRHEARNLRVLCRPHNQLVASEFMGTRRRG